MSVDDGLSPRPNILNPASSEFQAGLPTALQKVMMWPEYFWRSRDRASLMYSSTTNKMQLYTIFFAICLFSKLAMVFLIKCNLCSTCFRRFLRPSSGAQNILSITNKMQRYTIFFITVNALDQRFSNFFQVGTTFISQNVLRTTLLLGLSNSLTLP